MPWSKKDRLTTLAALRRTRAPALTECVPADPAARRDQFAEWRERAAEFEADLAVRLVALLPHRRLDGVLVHLDQGVAGDNIGCLLRGVDKAEIERGQVLAKPGSVKPHTKFKAEVYVLSKEEGGRHTPFFNGYRPQFYFRTTDVTGVVNLPEGVEMVVPGDNVQMEVELISPIAMEEGLRFAIREGGRTVGAGVVTAIKA